MEPAMRPAFPETSPQVDFPALEQEILSFWQREHVFERSIGQRRDAGAPDYTFYDGPPFATGLPHYGHILTSYVKDTIPRYFTMRGYTVDRRFGWDCHGLPVEFEIERELGISGKRAIEEHGVGRFNDKCAGAVMRYAREWETVITRLGRWVDFQREYKTMDLDYMESVMRVFRELWDKGLIYEGDKVVPYCYRCQTPLSNFEARLDDSFRPRQDPSVVVRFRLGRSEGSVPEFMLAWTTTPWTLPGNVALAVAPEVEYVCLEADDGRYWLAAPCSEALRQHLGTAEPVARRSGAQLVGVHYEPIFPWFSRLRGEGAFRVIAADFVTTDDGTGVVHIAPAFGEDDSDVGAREGLPRPCPVDGEGRFTSEVADFAGLNVHNANRSIIRRLKDDGSLVVHQTHEHNYPHCWRDDTPLIYRTIPTWYLNVARIKERMLAANEQINWVPAHIRDGRFGDWLRNARDWAISRNRYWGAPLPVWRCDVSGEMFVPGSIAELEVRSGRRVMDLHRPAVDEVTFPSNAGGVFRRVPEVLDCWFESGAMPYAQVHYPFENKAWFESNFPADFIVEYIAQTRGWFYTLVVLSAALFDRPPFSNCLCHGVVLAEDGRKMSKRLRNYPDPMEIVHDLGSDALRISLLSSPVVRGLNVRFSRRDVEEAQRALLIPLWNAYHFFTAYANLDGWRPAPGVVPETADRTDRYILASLEELKEQLARQMDAYDIVAAYDSLRDFIEHLNNFYIRLNRRRFWTDEDPARKRTAYEVLYAVLRELCIVSAPLIPFTSESIYHGLCGAESSVHLQDWPVSVADRRDPELVQEVSAIQRVLYLGRQIRERHGIKIRQPLALLTVAGITPQLLDAYRGVIAAELNVKEVRALADPPALVQRQLRLDRRILGPKHGKRLPGLLAAAVGGDFRLLPDGTAEMCGVVLDPAEYCIEYLAADPESGCAATGDLVVLLSLHIDESLRLEGVARDLIRAVQELRKQAGLSYSDRIRLGIAGDSPMARGALARHATWICSETLALEVAGEALSGAGVAGSTLALDDGEVQLGLCRHDEQAPDGGLESARRLSKTLGLPE